jgi:spermidine/putrescine transport system substrate-binding protein
MKKFCKPLQFVCVLPILAVLGACQSSAQREKSVHLAIWSNFITPQMISDFEAQSGYRVVLSHYSSNEELLAKLQAGAGGLDVAVPSDYMVQAMRQLQLLETIDQSKITSWKDINPQLMGLGFDPKNEHSIPFNWGTTGMAVHRKLTSEKIESWAQVFESDKLKGRISLLDDARETLGLSLKIGGKSLNARDEAEIRQAQERLEGFRPRLKSFTSETLSGLVQGEMAVAHAYSSDALQAGVRTEGKVEYLIPQEGCTLWIDTLVIPKGAKNREGAHALINFLLSPSIGAERATKIWVAPSNQKSIDLIDESFRKHAGLFPSKEALARCETIEDVGESLRAWDRAWTQVKAAAN